MANTSKHPNSRTVTLFRAGSILSRAQGAEVDDFFSSSKQPIGSYFDSVNSLKVGSGLTFAEEELLLPGIIDTPASDKDFRKKVTDFYSDLTTPVPHGTGTVLEIGLESSNDIEVSKKNMPLNLMDYLRYRHALKHPWVAENQDKAKGDQTIHWYIFDKYAMQAKNTKRIKEQDAAMQVYLKIKNDPAIVDQVLTLLGIDPRTFIGPEKEGLKIEALRNKLETDPIKFTSVYEDGNLEIRYAIQTMINVRVLKQVGSRLIDAETEKIIGNTLEEAIYYFLDDEKSDEVVTLKARMQEAMEKEPVIEKRKTVLPTS